MDGQRFDNLTRTLAGGTTRRRALKMLGGGFAAVVAAALGDHRSAHAATECPLGTTPCGDDSCCLFNNEICCADGTCASAYDPRDCGCDHLDCGACGACDNGVCVPIYEGFQCRASEGPCDMGEYCDGVSMDCPADTVVPAGYICRGGTSPCEGNATCNGVDKTCPPNPPAPAGVRCRQPENFCDLGAFCDGQTFTCPPSQPRPAGGSPCRNAAGPCDLPEYCDGVSRFCPPDQFRPSTHQCRAATGDCDLPEFCTGVSAQCPADARKPAGTVCREATGPCDVAEVCNGTSALCPPNQFQPAGTPCGDTDVCNGLEICDGLGRCVPGAPLDCDDGDVCTADTCDPDGGCIHTPIDGCCRDDAECIPPDACTIVSCANNICVEASLSCDDGNVCTDDRCDPVSGCVHDPIPGCCLADTDCDDGDPCTINRCEGSVCVTEPVTCPDDGNPCTGNVCIDGACQAIPAANDTACGANGGCWDGVCIECDHKREVYCVGQCRRKSDFNQDDRNCGACGNVCPQGMICKGGFCVKPTR